MTTAETILIVVALLLIFLVIGNLVFSKLAERRNPPVGKFIQCDGVRLHYIGRSGRSLCGAVPWQWIRDARLYEQRP